MKRPQRPPGRSVTEYRCGHEDHTESDRPYLASIVVDNQGQLWWHGCNEVVARSFRRSPEIAKESEEVLLMRDAERQLHGVPARVGLTLACAWHGQWVVHPRFVLYDIERFDHTGHPIRRALHPPYLPDEWLERYTRELGGRRSRGRVDNSPLPFRLKWTRRGIVEDTSITD